MDLCDFFVYMKMLLKSDNVVLLYDFGFLFNMCFMLGGWKLFYFNDQLCVELVNVLVEVKCGQYLVEGFGYCGECYMFCDIFGGLKMSVWFVGGLNLEGKGMILNIMLGFKVIGSWSVGDIVNYLEMGFMLEFDSVGGLMVVVQQNMVYLMKEDCVVIVVYLKVILVK